MSNRKTLKVQPETKERLEILKDGETVDGLLNRAFDELEKQQSGDDLEEMMRRVIRDELDMSETNSEPEKNE
jgi:hypothetical protein